MLLMLLIEIGLNIVLFTLGLWIGVKIVAPSSRKNHIITAIIFGIVFTIIPFIKLPYVLIGIIIIGFGVLAAFTYELGFVQIGIVLIILVALMFLSNHILNIISMQLEIPR